MLTENLLTAIDHAIRATRIRYREEAWLQWAEDWLDRTDCTIGSAERVCMLAYEAVGVAESDVVIEVIAAYLVASAAQHYAELDIDVHMATEFAKAVLRRLPEGLEHIESQRAAGGGSETRGGLRK